MGTKLASFVGIILLGLWDFISDLLYYYKTPFNSAALKEAFLTFLFLSMGIQIVSWSNIIVKVTFKEDAESANHYLDANSYWNARLIILKQKCMHLIQLLWCLIKNIPLIILITITQKIKIFPLILFGYTYFRYNAVLTTDLMRSLVPIMDDYHKKNKSDKSKLITQKNQMRRKEEIIINTLHDNNPPQIAAEHQIIFDIQAAQKTVFNKIHDSHRNQHHNEISQNVPGVIPNKEIINNANQNIILDDILNETDRRLEKSLLNEETSREIMATKGLQKKKSIGVEKLDSRDNNNCRKSNDCDNTHIEKTQQKQGEKGDGDDEQEKENNIDTSGSFFGINLLIDANIIPNLRTLLFDKNLQKFQVISDVLEAVFQSLPMTIIQYINNTQNQSWFNFDNSINVFLILIFISSAATLFLHCITLLTLLYDDDIQSFARILQYLDETSSIEFSRSNNSLKSSDSYCIQMSDMAVLQQDNPEKVLIERDPQRKHKTFGDIFPMRAMVEIDHVEQLSKLVRLTEAASKSIEQLKIILPNSAFSKSQISHDVQILCSKLINLTSLEMNFEGTEMGDVYCKPMLREILFKLPKLVELKLYLEQCIESFQALTDITEINLDGYRKQVEQDFYICPQTIYPNLGTPIEISDFQNDNDVSCFVCQKLLGL